MELTSINIVKELLAKHHAKPITYMGQNFLVDQEVLANIIKASDITPSDTILEIGPGIGTLTKELAKRAKKVVAIEKDRAMVEILKETIKDNTNVEIIQEDVLKFNLQNYSLQTTNYKLVANIPYYLTSPLIRKFLEDKNQPVFMILMVQKEVAQRICAKPPHMSLLAVSVQFYAAAKIISYVKKESFWPSPKVDSAIIKITPFDRLEKVSHKKFFKIVKAGFSQPRKQLANNLSKGLKKDRSTIEAWLLKNNIKPTQRAETLTIKDWMGLTSTLDVVK